MKFLLLFILSCSIAYGNYDKLTDEFNQAKINYLKAVVNGNTDDEIKNLNTVINVGKQLKVDTRKYESALSSIYSKQSNTKQIKQPQPTPKTEELKVSNTSDTIITNQTTTKESIFDSKYSISAVETKENDIIIRFNKNISAKDIKFIQEKGKPNKDIFEINGSFKDAVSTVLQIEGIDRIIVNQQTPNKLRISIINKNNPKSVYMVSGNNIIIRTTPTKTITNTQTVTETKQETQIAKTTFLRSRTIVIDPGHGGKDPGAVLGNNQEKTAVLAVGLYLKDFLINRGYTVYMTRNSDKFLELKERTSFANDKNADLFISIHANAVEAKNASYAKGMETYFLSPARSDRAKKLAALENKQEMQDLDDSSQTALLTIMNRSKITASNKLAIDIQRYMLHEARKTYKDTTDNGVREGPFYVLLGAQMPSVLIEIGYITHGEEGKRIFERNYQKNLALGIANGIDSYFLNNP
ncbi:MAG: N-acetylmuramoyl-L-alanine amidase [Arcobacteraceae bacterium]